MKNMIKKTITLVVPILMSGCASMVWHEGSMIQYKDIKEIEKNKYSMEILGGWRHNQEILEDAVLKKARSLCNGEAEILSSSMDTYHTSTSGGGVITSGNPPKIISTVQCLPTST